jgi:hypothetical protein
MNILNTVDLGDIRVLGVLNQYSNILIEYLFLLIRQRAETLPCLFKDFSVRRIAYIRQLFCETMLAGVPAQHYPACLSLRAL